MRTWPSTIALLSVVLLAGCPNKPLPADTQDLSSAPAGPPVLKRPSRSATIAISDDDALVAMVVPEEGTLVTFNAQGLHVLGRARTGAGPSSVVLHPDGKTAFVANRGDATVVRVSELASTTPSVSSPVSVGAEPTGLTLSPSGATLFVAEFAEGRLSVIDTATMTVTRTVGNLRAPRALLVTNNGDATDRDEVLAVTEFFADGPADGTGEAMNSGRAALVRLLPLANLDLRTAIVFQPLGPEAAGFGAAAAPNQLGAVAARGRRLYLTATGVSPEPPLRADSNVNPLLLVADLDALREVQGGGGSFSLAGLIKKASDAGDAGLSYLADPADVDFAPQTSVAYVVSRGADAVQRVTFSEDGTSVRLGASVVQQIDLSAAGCRGPTGIALAGGASRAFVNCWLSQRLAVLDLSTQTVASTLPAAERAGPEDAVARGRGAFYSARGRWSQQGWSSCASCHPDGGSDGVTWSFPTGPRQTPSLDGAYSRSNGAMRQRTFGWTATWDEIHDFEALVRLAGGKGAITTSTGNCGDLLSEQPVELASSALGTPTAAENQSGPGTRCSRDLDDVESFLRALRPPKGRRGGDLASMRRGAALFGTGGCVKCHGGAGWSVSRRFYEPSTATNTQLSTQVSFTRPAAWPASWSVHSTTQIAPQPTAAEVAGQNSAPIGPPQLACALRSVGTFGVSDGARSDALEKKADGGRAQGRGGYAVPALYGLALGAPYLHHGQAPSLQALFSEARFRGHTEAGAAGFLQGEGADKDREDLINYLLTIDGDAVEQPVPTGFDAGCQGP